MMHKLFNIFVALCIATTAFAEGWSISTDSVLTIKSNYNYFLSNEYPWHSSRDKIKSVKIESDVTCIGNYAFHDCRGLTDITIPNSVTSIGEYAFINCSRLKKITCSAPEPPTLGNDAFKGITATIIVPCGSLESYESQWGEKYPKLTFEMAFLYNFKVAVNDTTMGKAEILTQPSCDVSATIQATPNDGYKFVMWDNGDTHANTTVSIKSNMTRTACFAPADLEVTLLPVCDAFWYYDTTTKTLYVCGYGYGDLGIYSNKGGWGNLPISEVEHVIVDNRVKSIDACVFQDFTVLQTAQLPSKLSEMDSQIFNNCENLTSVNIPNGIKSIGYATFAGCSSLTEITIPSSINSISSQAFNNCTSLTTITCKSTTPAMVYSGAFSSSIINTAQVIVPCGYESAYTESDYWGSTFLTIVEDFVFDFSAISADELMGTVKVAQEPDCDNIAIFEAMPAENYHFVKWSDGNTSAYREETLTDDLIVKAIFEKDVVHNAISDIEYNNDSKTIKTIEDGRVVIIRDGKKYDLRGVELQ